MIYLDFSKKLQVIHIPKNGDYTGKIENKPTFDEGYDKGYQDGLEDCECGECPECNEGSKYHTVKTDVETLYASVDGLDGYNMVEINASEYGNKKYEEGYNQGKSECGECPECPEGGSCNVQDGSFEFYDMENGHYWKYAYEYGLDGWKYIDIDASEFGRQKYNEGYNQGKSECDEGGSCNLGDLNVEWDAGWNTNNFYAEREGLDGYRTVSINVENALTQKYEEGYEQGKSECPELTELNVIENGTYEGSFNKVNVTVNATDFSSEQVENKYSHLVFITRNIQESQTVVDKSKLVDSFDNYTPNGSINITQFKNGMCFAIDEKYLNPDFNGGCVVRKIEDGAIDWNAVDIFRSYTILEFGENMTRDKGSNLLNLYIYASTFRNETVIFNDGCFATSNRLNKIVFEEPFNVIVKGNQFEGIDSWGQFIVKGEESNRSKYTDLINLLPTDWEVIFNPDYEE